MKPSALVLLLAWCGCSGGSGRFPAPQILDLRDIGAWHLVETAQVIQKARDYTIPPDSFTVYGETLARLGGVPFTYAGWLDAFYGGVGELLSFNNTFDNHGQIAPPRRWTQVTSLMWRWVDDEQDPTRLEVGAFSLSIDETATWPQVRAWWQIWAWDVEGDLVTLQTENSATELVFTPSR